MSQVSDIINKAVNPRSINTTCLQYGPTDKEQCLVDVISALTKNKAANDELAQQLASLHDSLYGQFQTATAVGNYSALPGIQVAYTDATNAINLLLGTKDAAGYIPDADSIIADVTKKITDLQASSAYKAAIASGAKPASPPVDTTVTVPPAATNNNLLIGGAIAGVLLLILVIALVLRPQQQPQIVRA